ncbi:MAG: nucleotidyl transferase AbiEii/AbiGii toxin family protein, partial [Verrucomicrobia bacterium]|nr:nucleotidyl transferase AbiEii/AbiGii toxin family protein [Verrucomicrobiota bacterium]
YCLAGINTREHFSVQGIRDVSFLAESRWFSGRCDLPRYSLEELLGTKLRALYQRRKGRDLFDLWLGLTKGGADPEAILTIFRHPMDAEGSLMSGELSLRTWRYVCHVRSGRRRSCG